MIFFFLQSWSAKFSHRRMIRTVVVVWLVALAVSAIVCHSLASPASLLVQTRWPLFMSDCALSSSSVEYPQTCTPFRGSRRQPQGPIRLRKVIKPRVIVSVRMRRALFSYACRMIRTAGTLSAGFTMTAGEVRLSTWCSSRRSSVSFSCVSS